MMSEKIWFFAQFVIWKKHGKNMFFIIFLSLVP